jgi:hypothetical protein
VILLNNRMWLDCGVESLSLDDDSNGVFHAFFCCQQI